MKKDRKMMLVFVVILFCLAVFFYVDAGAPLLSRSDKGEAVKASSIEPSSTEASSRHRVYASGPVGTQEALRSDPRRYEELPDAPLAPQFDRLLERAERDPAFSYTLASMLQECSILNLEEEAYLDKAESGEHGRAFEIEQAGHLEEKQRRCEGVEDSAEIRYGLIDRAAAVGIVEAQIAFRAIAADFIASEEAMKRRNAQQQYKEKVLKYAYAAARGGSPEALFNAYEVTSSGLFAPSNEVLAYTYLYAYSKARPSPRTSHLLTIESRRLSISDLASARDAAEKILAGSAGKGAGR